MTTERPDTDDQQALLDAEVREDEAVWDKARAEFDQFQKDQKGMPAEEVEKALHKWTRHHGISMDDDEVATKAVKISAGEAVELADIPSAPGLSDQAEA